MKSTIHKLTWFVGLYALSILALGSFSFLVRWALGMHA